jgi:uncharacterized surface protein with fasciclin (FAS1) repeats
METNMNRSLSLLFVTSLTLFGLGACATDDEDVVGPDDTIDQVDDTIIGTADAAGDFTTLLAAVDAAGLTETLRSEGPFTVFAPTDAAFDALPEGVVSGLLEDAPALTDVLLYHVLDEEVMAAALVESSLVTTMQGSDFKVTTDGGVFVNGAEVTVNNIETSNGVIHVIDAVIVPPPTITDIAIADGRFETLVAALTAAELADTLAGEGPFTVFAPTDDAFAALPDGTVTALLDDIPLLTDILLYHVTGQRLPAGELVGESTVVTLQGQSLTVTMDEGAVMLDDAQVIITDIPAANGVIHVIDSVVLPE